MLSVISGLKASNVAEKPSAAPVAPTAVSKPRGDSRNDLDFDLAAKSKPAPGQAEAEKAEEKYRPGAVKDAMYAIQVAFDQHGQARMSYRSGYRTECPLLESSQALDHLKLLVRDKCRERKESVRIPSDQLLERELALLRAEARKKPHINVFRRVAIHGGAYWLDTADTHGRCIRVNESGWHVLAQPEDLLFARPDGIGAIGEPARPADINETWSWVSDGLSALGIPAARHIEVAVALVEWQRPDTPFPILEFVGAAGTGKTSAARNIVGTIDPRASGHLPSVKLTAEDIGAAAQAGHVLPVDNVGKALSGDAQDIVCITATGGELQPRKFHMQTETARLPVKNPILLTSITPSLTRPDAITRSIRIQFRPLQGDYVGEVEIQARFEVLRPKLLGGLLSLMVAGLAGLPAVKASGLRWNHRLVDFAMMGEAVSQATGHKAGYFVASLQAMRGAVAEEIAEGDPFITALLAALNTLAAQADGELPSLRTVARGEGIATGRRSDGVVVVVAKAERLLAQVTANKPAVPFGLYSQGWMPGSGRELSGAITRATPLLADLGIKAEQVAASPRNSLWQFAIEPRDTP